MTVMKKLFLISKQMPGSYLQTDHDCFLPVITYSPFIIIFPSLKIYTFETALVKNRITGNQVKSIHHYMNNKH
jgi:hypothetical protein